MVWKSSNANDSYHNGEYSRSGLMLSGQTSDRRQTLIWLWTTSGYNARCETSVAVIFPINLVDFRLKLNSAASEWSTMGLFCAVRCWAVRKKWLVFIFRCCYDTMIVLCAEFMKNFFWIFRCVIDFSFLKLLNWCFSKHFIRWTLFFPLTFNIIISNNQ